MTLKPEVIRPGLKGHSQNVVLCPDLSRDEQVLKECLKGAYDQVCVSEVYSGIEEVWS